MTHCLYFDIQDPRTDAVVCLASASSAASGGRAPIAVDDQCVMIHDLYPKARYHALVVARDTQLEGPSNLTKEHTSLLQHMQVGRHALESGQHRVQDTLQHL